MYISGERAWCLRRVILRRGVCCNECACSLGPFHRERPVVHDESSQARRRFELWHLRHGGHDSAFAARGQALRLRRPRLRLTSRQSIAPINTHLRFRTDPPDATSYLYSTMRTIVNKTLIYDNVTISEFPL